jgi:hypothetical protein
MEQSLQSVASDAQLSGPLQGAIDFITSPFRALGNFIQNPFQGNLFTFLIGFGAGMLVSEVF